MYIAVTGKAGNKDVYIYESFRKPDGKTSSHIHRKLGKFNDLLRSFNGSEEEMMAWAREEAKKDTEEQQKNTGSVSITLHQASRIPLKEERIFNVGYLFLQKLCADLRINQISRRIREKYRFQYDFEAILTDLVYARILSPSSKLSSYEYCRHLLEPPKYALEDVYRALSVMAKESDFIQSELYKNSGFVHSRNQSVLYYDCTNYYFEIEQERGDAYYGKSKENRPNPIIGMGLFMDADGIPLAFSTYPGNQNEQISLLPLEKKVIDDFDCSRFIFCSDSGLGSRKNRKFNNDRNMGYVITQSLKKMKKEDRNAALDPRYFKAPGSEKHIDISKLDETDPIIRNTIYYKEIPFDSSGMDEIVIVTYSPKYKAYQRQIRNAQIARAQKIIDNNGKMRKGKNENDPYRFVRKTPVTNDGEIAKKYVCELDEERIQNEEQYDGFYAVVTNLEDDPLEIVRINEGRWEIEECFRIMKTEFEARPVYLQRDDRIKAHFLTCFIALLVYRLLEQKLGKKYTCRQILNTLSGMNVTSLSSSMGYIPSYQRTNITDDLHRIFGFQTDFEYITRAKMRSIIKTTKERTKEKISTG
jgi:transposase